MGTLLTATIFRLLPTITAARNGMFAWYVRVFASAGKARRPEGIEGNTYSGQLQGNEHNGAKPPVLLLLLRDAL